MRERTMMQMGCRPRAAVIFVALLVAACGPTTQGTQCLTPAPEPFRPVDLVFPIPGSTAVPTGIGVLVVQGAYSSIQAAFGGSLIVNLTTKLGLPVASASIGPAPSPLPSPLATPPEVSLDPKGGISIPPLSGLTTYVVTFTHNDHANNPPSCVAPTTDTIGSFTTR